MLDDLLDKMIEKTVQYCSDEKNRDKLVKPLEDFITDRFVWIVRCFEVVACLTVIQTLLLVYLLFKYSSR